MNTAAHRDATDQRPDPIVSRLLRNPATWYVAVLTAMWPVEAALSASSQYSLQLWASTNLDHLRDWQSLRPIQTLVLSAFVPSGSSWAWPILALSVYVCVSVFGALGAVLRLAAVNIGVSLVTEGMVWWRIQYHSLPSSDAHMLDTGPSYVIVAAMAVAMCCSRRWWARVVWLVLLVIAAPGLLDGLSSGDLAAVGHILCFGSGVAMALFGPRRRRCQPAE